MIPTTFIIGYDHISLFHVFTLLLRGRSVYKLLIENVAASLRMNLTELDDLQLRKLCILIDWTLTLFTYQPGNSITPLLSGNILLADDLTHKLTDAIQADGFNELNEQNPDSEQMDDMFKRLGHHLGFSDDVICNVDTGFISDYEKGLADKGLVYTNYLTYKKKLSSQEQKALGTIEQQLRRQYPWLNVLPIFQLDNNSCISVFNALNNTSSTVTALETYLFSLELLNQLAWFQRTFKRNVSAESVLAISSYLSAQLDSLPVSKEIEQGLTQLISQSKKSPQVDLLRETLARYLARYPELRDWKNLEHFPAQPIHRIILLGYQDVADEEIIRVINLMYRKHPHENIAVTFNPEDVKKINNPFTLQVIGHGNVEDPNTINANLGPFRGNARRTGLKVAELVNACPHIMHVRLSSCFSGKLTGNNLDRLSEKRRTLDQVASHARRTLSMMLNDNLTPNNSPFVDYCPAVSCWNAIRNKEDRSIMMTVSPGIIEPEEALGCMVWKTSTYDATFERGIKDIHLTSAANYLPGYESCDERTVCTNLQQVMFKSDQRKHHF